MPDLEPHGEEIETHQREDNDKLTQRSKDQRSIASRHVSALPPVESLEEKSSKGSSSEGTSSDGESSDGTSSDGTSSEGTGSEDDDTPLIHPPVDLKSRVAMFLPQLQAANEGLQQGDMAGFEDVDDEEQHIEMNLGLGVLTDKRSDIDSESSSEDESDADAQQRPNKRKIEEVT